MSEESDESYSSLIQTEHEQPIATSIPTLPPVSVAQTP